jgi:hypothetical protein
MTQGPAITGKLAPPIGTPGASSKAAGALDGVEDGLN